MTLSARKATGSRPRNGGQFKYQAIATELGESIDCGHYPPASVLPSETELAEQFAVNRMTMRKALGLLRDRGAVKSYQGKGTVVVGPTAGTAVGSVLYVGLVRAHLFANIVVEAQRAAQETGVRFQSLETPEEDSPRWQRTLAEYARPADGLIVSADVYHRLDRAVVERAARVVLVGDEAPAGDLGANTCCVLTDQMRAVALATSHLLELGHRRILLAAGDMDLPPTRVGRRAAGPPWPAPLDRYYGAYRGALATHQVDDYEGVVRCRTRTDDPDTAHVVELLRAPDRPTAIVCQPDFRARSVYAAAARAGLRIPDDLSVIGINDTPWAPAMVPALTSVNVGEAQIGRLALQILLTDAPLGKLPIRVMPSLHWRDSVAPPPV